MNPRVGSTSRTSATCQTQITTKSLAPLCKRRPGVVPNSKIRFPHPLTGPARVNHGCYRYTDDLLQLEASARGSNDTPHQGYPLVAGFLPLESWAPFLHCHPDQRYAAFLRWGISHGLRIGCQPQDRLETAPLNLQSARTTRS